MYTKPGNLKKQDSSDKLSLISERLRNLRKLLGDEELRGFKKKEEISRSIGDSLPLLVGWAVLKQTRLGSLENILELALAEDLPELVLFYDSKKEDFLAEKATRLGFSKNELLKLDIVDLHIRKVWKLVRPNDCRDLPLHINLRTGTYICGKTNTENRDKWMRGRPHSVRPPSAILNPDIKNVIDWIKHVYPRDPIAL